MTSFSTRITLKVMKIMVMFRTYFDILNDYGVYGGVVFK